MVTVHFAVTSPHPFPLYVEQISITYHDHTIFLKSPLQSTIFVRIHLCIVIPLPPFCFWFAMYHILALILIRVVILPWIDPVFNNYIKTPHLNTIRTKLCRLGIHPFYIIYQVDNLVRRHSRAFWRISYLTGMAP